MTKKSVIKIPSEIKYIGKVSSRVLESLKAYRLDEDRLFDIRLCVEEAVRNAVEHGNNLNKNLPVKVTWWIEDDLLKVEVEDKGAGFDYKRVPDPTINENLTKGSGRGVYIIHHLMDEVVYSNSGNKIMMAKRLK